MQQSILNTLLVTWLITLFGIFGCTLDSEGHRVVGTSGLGNPDLYAKKIEVKDRSQFIARYLSGNDLSPIEGIWIWPDSQNEVAIIRNPGNVASEYDFAGIITDAQDSWSRGQTKLLLKETATREVFSGIFYMSDGSQARSA